MGWPQGPSSSRADGVSRRPYHGRTRAVRPGDSADLADAIGRAVAIAEDPERRRVIVDQGRLLALDHDVHAVARRSLESYSMLARARR